MAVSVERKPKTLFIILVLICVALLGVFIFLSRSYLVAFTDPEQAQQIVSDAGPWAPIVFIVMQIAQVFFAPIPGQVTGFVGGYLFGTLWGTVYTMIGALIGFTLIFILARKLGRPFVEYFVDRKNLEKFDYLAKTKGPFVLFLIFLLPAFPDDLISFIAGLTNIRIRTLIIISLLGRFPGYLVLSFTGAGVAKAHIHLTIIVFTIMMIISALAYWQRAKLEQFVHRLAK